MEKISTPPYACLLGIKVAARSRNGFRKKIYLWL